MHYLAHFADGAWDHAQEIADGFAVRVTTAAEARLSAMALFVAVARGLPIVDERRRWLEPMFDQDEFVEYITRGLLAGQARWRGDAGTALSEVRATIRAIEDADDGYHGPQLIRVAAVGLGALAAQAVAGRAAGDLARAAAAQEQAVGMLDIACDGAANPRFPGFALGVDGRGWLARAEPPLPAGVHPVAPAIDEQIARLTLESSGTRIDALTPAQQEYLRSWRHRS